MEKVAYKGWPNCYRLANERVELVVTGDVGPRIIRFGFLGGDNAFAEFAEQAGQTGGTDHRMYGGHRLWHSPEDKARSYYPDNFPVEVVEADGAVRVLQPLETTTGIQKEMVITLEGPNHVRVKHSLCNFGVWPVELAPWALTMMALGGLAIIPQPSTSHPDGLLPNRVLVLWPYTDMADPRVRWGSNFILVRQDPGNQNFFKLGLSADDGWLAYLNGDQLFVKTFDYVPGAAYPDHGCSVEMFTNDRFLELESLGPLGCLHPGEVVEHVEHWFLFRGVEADLVPSDEAAIGRAVLPFVTQAQKQSDR